MAKPKIRFKGYQEDWEQRKLGEVAKEFKSGNSLKADEIGITGDYPVYGGNGLRGYTSTYNHDGEFALIGRQGALCGNMNYSVGKAYFTEHAVVVKADENNDTKFMYYMLDTMNLGQYSDQSAQPGLAVNKLVKLENLFPQKEEQQRIGLYFSNVDHLITLHQRKCDQTKKLKKFMLQKMFPQNGKKVPELRFSEFTDDWEQRKFGEIASSFEYGLNVAAKEYDGENKYIRITDIDDNTHKFLSDSLTSPDIDLTGAENYKLAKGDILFARTGASVGKSYIYRDYDGLVYYAGFLIRARIRDEYDAEFVFQNTLTDKYNKYIAVTSQRSGQPGVNAQEYSEFKIQVPKKEEQIKIGKYFQNLDHLITLHQRKYEELQKVKKFMLQNMFV